MNRAYFIGGAWDGVQKILQDHLEYLEVAYHEEKRVHGMLTAPQLEETFKVQTYRLWAKTPNGELIYILKDNN